MDLTQLYRGPIEEFVTRRGELARQLRGDDPEGAALVAKLRKPPAPVWAIDQLAADRGDLLAELLAAGTDAADAQRAVSEGAADGEALRAASVRLRDAVDAAAKEALAALERDGHAAGDDTARRIRTTLLAASGGTTDERAALWNGTLEHELHPTGFGPQEATGADDAAVTAAIAPLRRAPADGGHTRRPARHQASNAAALRAARHAATERDRAAEHAREVAGTKRHHAELLADGARTASQDADAAERAAHAADRAAAEARHALEVLERADQ